MREENCIANLLFPDDVLCTMTAGFVKPGALPAWSVTLIGTDAAAELLPGENEGGTMTVYHGDSVERLDYTSGPNAFEVQAATFMAALTGDNACLNRPEDAIWDVRVAEALVTSAAEKRVVTLDAGRLTLDT